MQDEVYKQSKRVISGNKNCDRYVPFGKRRLFPSLAFEVNTNDSVSIFSRRCRSSDRVLFGLALYRRMRFSNHGCLSRLRFRQVNTLLIIQ